MTPRKVADRNEAVQLLHDAAASGLPRADWARLHGINARSLNAWRVIFERKDARRSAPPLHLVELVPRSDPPSGSGVRVRCGVMVVDIDPSFEDHVLARVLAAVVRC